MDMLVEAVVAAEDEEDVDEEEVVDEGKGTVGQMDVEVEKEDHGLKGETVDAVDETQTAVDQANLLPVAAAERMPLQQHNQEVYDPLIFTIDLIFLVFNDNKGPHRAFLEDHRNGGAVGSTSSSSPVVADGRIAVRNRRTWS